MNFCQVMRGTGDYSNASHKTKTHKTNKSDSDY